MFGSFGIDIALNSTMSGIVRLCKMKGEPVLVYSGTTRKYIFWSALSRLCARLSQLEFVMSSVI